MPASGWRKAERKREAEIRADRKREAGRKLYFAHRMTKLAWDKLTPGQQSTWIRKAHRGWTPEIG